VSPVADRVALVTGAARGIGAATVLALAAGGWRVVAVDRCADDPALPYPLGSREELDRVVASACAAAGGRRGAWSRRRPIPVTPARWPPRSR
jgi:NAD(P)-dependent dehydrogenase (short-subunit alcohol dehydrogenase family)